MFVKQYKNEKFERLVDLAEFIWPIISSIFSIFWPTIVLIIKKTNFDYSIGITSIIIQAIFVFLISGVTFAMVMIYRSLVANPQKIDAKSTEAIRIAGIILSLAMVVGSISLTFNALNALTLAF